MQTNSNISTKEDILKDSTITKSDMRKVFTRSCTL
jgi:hypothetical protein